MWNEEMGRYSDEPFCAPIYINGIKIEEERGIERPSNKFMSEMGKNARRTIEDIRRKVHKEFCK